MGGGGDCVYYFARIRKENIANSGLFHCPCVCQLGLTYLLEDDDEQILCPEKITLSSK